METYTFLRAFADSWMLLLLFCIFLGVIFWVFRPGSKEQHQDSAEIPFRHDDRPAPDTPRTRAPDQETDT